MNEWDKIEGFDGWSAKLQSLLQEAKQVARSDDLSARLEVVKQLTDFVVNSTPNTADIVALDEIAIQARKDLTLSTIESRVDAIVSRTSELVGVTKRFQSLAADASEAAASISLEQVQKTVASLTDTVVSLKELRRVLVAGKHDELIARANTVLGELQALRHDVEQLG